MDRTQIIKSTISDFIGGLLVLFLLLFSLIWNIDDIWQIDFEPVKQFQKKNFPNKYEMELRKTKLYSINSDQLSAQKIKIHDLQFELKQTRSDLESFRHELREYKKTGLETLKRKIKAQIDLIDSLDIEDQSAK